MSEWLILLNWLTFAWLTGWAIRALRNITSNRRRSVSSVLLVFFLLFGVPIALDLMRGIPEYIEYPGFRATAREDVVVIIYDLFVVACPLFWWLTTGTRRNNAQVTTTVGQNPQRVLWLLLCSPPIAVLFAPQPEFYLSYGAVVKDTMSLATGSFNVIIAALTLIAVTAGAGLLLFRRNYGRTFWLIMPFMTIAMWLNGKRSLVALVVALFWITAWLRGFMTRPKIVAWGAVTLIIFGGYIAWYQMQFRPVAALGPRAYDNSRIDFGRDHNLKAAISCELSDGSLHILDYRGQSLLFDLTMFVPRSIWPDKPWPYAIYMTGFALQQRPRDLGWGLTNSWLDEAIANFGWAGFLVGPLLFTVLCRICDRTPDPLVNILGNLIACLLLAVQVAAFAPLVIAWLLYMGWSTDYFKRKRHTTSIRHSYGIPAASR